MSLRKLAATSFKFTILNSRTVAMISSLILLTRNRSTISGIAVSIKFGISARPTTTMSPTSLKAESFPG